MDPAAERKPVSFQGGNQRALEGLIVVAQRVIHVEEDPAVCIGSPPLPSEERALMSPLWSTRSPMTTARHWLRRNLWRPSL